MNPFDPSIKFTDTPRVQVRIGDILVVKDRGYRVRNIVPRQKQTGAIGWIELEAHSMSRDELKKQSGRIVEPMAP